MKRTLALLFSILSFCDAYCCWTHDYLPQSYFMFRILGNNLSGRIERSDETVPKNCAQWRELAGRDIDTADIRKLVYGTDAESMRQLLSSYSGNTFSDWIYDNDQTDIADYLILAKDYEKIRKEQTTAWYYPDDIDIMTIDSIYTVSSGYDGTRLKDRYSLMALRCLFALGKYKECLELWDEKKTLFPEDGVLYRLAIGYVAGVLSRTGQKDRACRIFLEIGDMDSFFMVSGKRDLPLIDKLRFIYGINPDSKEILSYIQKYIHGNTDSAYRDWDKTLSELELHDQLKEFVTTVIAENRSVHMAEYCYTAAYLNDQEGKYDESLKYIKSAKGCRMSQDMEDALRVLELWVRCGKQVSYTSGFESYLLRELKWLDRIMLERLDASTKERIVRNGRMNLTSCISQYYWYDMMRKIVLGKVVPLCIGSGKEVKALQFANMADNRILQLVPNTVVYNYYDGSSFEVSWDRYRMLKKNRNSYDYQTDYFRNLDTLGIVSLKRLADKLLYPSSDMDRFLSERGYRSVEFIYDIIGTRLTSEMKFREAAVYHSKVSRKFWESRNVRPDCISDPLTEKRYEGDESLRLHFAKEMANLEERISRTRDSNCKAELMLEYAKAITNISTAKYWPLVSFSFSPDNKSPESSRLYDEGIRIRDKAFALFTDRERAASAYCRWHLYRTAVERYGETHAALYVKGHCDNIRDYAPN